MNYLLLSVTAAALIWAAVFAVYIVLLRQRLLARFDRGFLYSMLIAMVGGALMSSSIIGVWGFQAAKQLLEEEIVEELADIGTIVETELRNERQNVLRQIAGLGAALVPLIERQAPAAALNDRLTTALAMNERFLEVHVFDAEGRPLASTARTEHVEAISRQAIGANLDGKSFVSEAHRAASGRQVLFVSEPLWSGPPKAVRGAIAVRFDLQGELQNLVGTVTFNESGRATMIDGDGQVIAHHDETLLEKNVSAYAAVRAAWDTGTAGSIEADNERGEPRLFAYRPIANPATVSARNWVLLTEISRSELVAPVNKLRDELAIGIFLLLVISIAIAHQVATSVHRPLQALGDFAQRIGTGDLTTRVDVTGRDVAGRLGTTLNQMAVGLQERDHVKEVFGRYIATQVSDKILKGEVNLGGEAREVTVLFSDIRNFTGMSEQMTAQQVVAFLNDYFSEMVDAVFEHGGMLDKFIGDGLMAVFGSLGEDPDHARSAVLAALRMKALLAKINGERAMSGKPPIQIGIGMHTAEVVVGNIGSRKRLEYTVVGDGVNTSSRLQGLNKEFGTTILISETTHEAIKDQFETRLMPEAALRGKTKELRFYEVVSVKSGAGV